MTTTIRLAQQPEADALLARSPLAALVGMLLDQQIPMEWAFAGPYTIARRMDADDLDAHAIAAADPEAFAALLSEKPAVHRYPGSMAKRVQQLCQYLVAHYDGDAAAVWKDVQTGDELFARLSELPGYGKQKAQIFTALLGKQYGVRPKGWR
ncbi:MAG: Fe-S cluster assembly protein HesB, partial [Streptomycetaceae bacterium]|nr:Fe-S cluster assembly protein HesB [Streptomycetaceae bacterium]